jgi:AcrR family transcriptional regulator
MSEHSLSFDFQICAQGGNVMPQIDLSDFNLPEKEEKILAAAIQIFSEKGFSAATTKEIAKSAGVAEGTIFRYFKTKKDILRGILIKAINLFGGKLVIDGVEKIIRDTEGKDLRLILRELIYDRLRLVDSFFPMARVVISEALVHDDIRQAIYENIVVKALAVFQEFYVKASDNGLLRKDLDPLTLFRSILGNLAAFLAQKVLMGERMAITDLDAEIDKMLDIVINGIVPIESRRF